MKIRIEFVLEISSLAWADWRAIDEADAASDVSGCLTDAAADLPGMADTPAVVRWRRAGRAVKRPARLVRFNDWPTSYEPVKPRYAPDMLLKFECVIDVPAAAWATWATTDYALPRQDLAEYFTAAMADLPGISQTGAVLHWRVGGKTVRRPARYADHWPTAREDY